MPTSAEHVYSQENIIFQCEQSLKNLNVDVIDLYYFHHCDFGENDEMVEEALIAIDHLRKQGKIRYIGLSGYSAEELLRIAKKINPVVIQSWADIEHDEFIREGTELRKFMDDFNISYIPMMPFAQGKLLDKYRPENIPTFSEGDNRQGNKTFSAESLLRLAPRMKKLKERFGEETEDLARVALQYLLFQPVVASVIPGFRNLAQVKTNLAKSSMALNEDDIKYILEVFPREEMEAHPWA